MKKLFCRPVSLRDARNGKRIRVSRFRPGAALVPVCAPLPILGYWFRHDGGLTVYVAGPMPPDLRTAAEEGHTAHEHWLVSAGDGIREIDLTECRQDYGVLQPLAA